MTKHRARTCGSKITRKGGGQGRGSTSGPTGLAWARVGMCVCVRRMCVVSNLAPPHCSGCDQQNVCDIRYREYILGRARQKPHPFAPLLSEWPLPQSPPPRQAVRRAAPAVRPTVASSAVRATGSRCERLHVAGARLPTFPTPASASCPLAAPWASVGTRPALAPRPCGGMCRRGAAAGQASHCL